MNKRNYQKELEEIIDKNRANNLKPKLLLHVCCAPCSSYCLSLLYKHFEIITDFYNPNIFPEEEFEKRAKEFERFVSELRQDINKEINEIVCEADRIEPLIDVNISQYDPESFFEMAKGLENVPEGGERCFKCYRLRMEHAAKMAADLQADYFTTTLSISPLKNAEKINEIGEELAEKYGVAHLPSDFKKKEGYKQSIELSHKYDLYRQNYCGCVYSRGETETYEKLT